MSHALVDTQFECGLRLPKALRACEIISTEAVVPKIMAFLLDSLQIEWGK